MTAANQQKETCCSKLIKCMQQVFVFTRPVTVTLSLCIKFLPDCCHVLRGSGHKQTDCPLQILNPSMPSALRVMIQPQPTHETSLCVCPEFMCITHHANTNILMEMMHLCRALHYKKPQWDFFWMAGLSLLAWTEVAIVCTTCKNLQREANRRVLFRSQ